MKPFTIIAPALLLFASACNESGPVSSKGNTPVTGTWLQVKSIKYDEQNNLKSTKFFNSDSCDGDIYIFTADSFYLCYCNGETGKLGISEGGTYSVTDAQLHFFMSYSNDVQQDYRFSGDTLIIDGKLHYADKSYAGHNLDYFLRKK